MDDYKNYINLIKSVLKNFTDFNYIQEFMEKILPSIFDEYLQNGDNKIHNIDNLFRIYYKDKYKLLKNKYDVKVNDKLTFRFRRYDKKEYIINLLKKKNIPLEDFKNYKELAEYILKYPNISCYSKFIDEKYLDIHHNICINCYLNVPKYNYKNNKTRLYCKNCKKEDMIYCFQKPCEFENCLKQSLYAYDKRQFCAKHKKEDMKNFKKK